MSETHSPGWSWPPAVGAYAHFERVMSVELLERFSGLFGPPSADAVQPALLWAQLMAALPELLPRAAVKATQFSLRRAPAPMERLTFSLSVTSTSEQPGDNRVALRALVLRDHEICATGAIELEIPR